MIAAIPGSSPGIGQTAAPAPAPAPEAAAPAPVPASAAQVPLDIPADADECTSCGRAEILMALDERATEQRAADRQVIEQVAAAYAANRPAA